MRLQRNEFLRITVAVFILLVCAVSLVAQTSKGAIAGTVVDSSGAAIVGATVTATNQDTGENRTAVSGPTGGYRVEAVQPGTYKVSVSRDGFDTLTVKNLQVQASVLTPLDPKLKVGKTETTLTVEGTNNTVQTENGEISHNISTTEVTDLPLNGLNPIALVVTEPGINNVDQTGRGTSNGFNFAANGLSPRENNFLLDGQDNNDNSIQGQAFQPGNPYAIQEVTVLTNSYSAEFGRGGSTVTNVIYKGGTNKFHGSASELYSGSGLNAVDAADALGGVTSKTKVRFDTHTFGFAFGGPIVKDKLFFFGTGQWQRFYGNAQPATISAPTSSGIAALQAAGTPNAALLLQYFNGLTAAAPTGAPIAIGGGRQPVQFGFTQRSGVAQTNPDTQWNFKVDFQATQKDNISVRYLHDRSSLTPDFFNLPGSLPGLDTNQGGPSENVVTAYTHDFNSHAINELRASFGHFDFGFNPTPQTLANPLYPLPRISIAGISRFPLLGVNAAIPQGRGHQTYQVQDGFTYTAGRHTWKFGADVSRLIVRDAVPFNFFGTETFTAGGGFTALGNFIDNFAGSNAAVFAAKTFGTPVTRPRFLQTAYYAQDTWKVKTNLTLSLGVRYEFQPNPENQIGFPGYNLANGPFNSLTTPVLVRQDGNNFAPRVGIAYTPHFWPGLFGDNKTVIRAGYGIFYDSFYTNILDNSVASAPNAIATNINNLTTGRGLANATTLVPAIVPVLSPLATQTSVANNLVNPLIHQWNFDIQRELPGKFSATLAYVGTRGIRLFESDTINPFGGFNVPGNPASGISPRINPLRGAITVRDNTGDSHYHGGSIKVERAFSHGWLFRSSYTYSKAIDDGGDVFNAFGAGSVTPQNPFVRATNRGLSDFDVRHRFANAYVWDIPGFKGGDNGLTKIAGYVSRGWEVTGTLALQSGAPATPFIGGIDTNGDGNVNNGLPFLGTASAPINQVGIDGSLLGKLGVKGGVPGTIYSVNQANDNGIACVIGAAGCPTAVRYIIGPGLGNVARGSVFDPGSWLTDMAVVRHVKLPKWEGQELQFRVELYNVFNHPNQDSSGAFPTNLVNATDVPGNQLFDPNQAAHGGRIIKLQARWTF